MRRTSSEPTRRTHALGRLVAVVLLVAAALWTAPGPAMAQGAALDTYRANGVIAERFDGYVEIREKGAPSDAQALVESVNAQRRALYAKRAQETNVSVEEVGKLYATKITESAPKGTYFRQPGGNYVRK